MNQTPNVNRFANLYQLFHFAVSRNLKFPKIRLSYQNDTVIVKLAGAQSKYQGQLMITNDAGYGSPNNKYFGRITEEGAIVAGRDLTAGLEQLLEEFAADPVGVAQRYGKLTGNCMFCDKKLDDPTSVAVGYGPVCAKNWHLPHSAVKQSRKNEAIAPVTSGTPWSEDGLFQGLDNTKEAAADLAMAEDQLDDSLDGYLTYFNHETGKFEKVSE